MERLVQLLAAFRRGVPEAQSDALMDELNNYPGLIQLGSSTLPEPGMAVAFVQPITVPDGHGGATRFDHGDIALIRLDPRGQWRLWVEGEPWEGTRHLWSK